MVGPIRVLLRSLEIRILIPLSVVVAVVIAAHTLLGYHATRERLRQFVRDDVERCARLIGNATHDGMLLNRLDHVQSTFERLGRSPEFTAIRIYDKDGRVVLADDPDDRGVRLPIDNARCRPCHTPGVTPGAALPSHTNVLVESDGHDERRHYTTIRNEPGCAAAACHVHPADQPVLGVLEVGMTMAPFEQAVTDTRSRLLITTVALIALIGLVAAVFIRRFVHRPVARLLAGTRRIARGELDTSIEVSGNDEFADLGRAFNMMVADLQEARVELNEWSRTLEKKVDAKSRALERAREQMVRVETMASLGKLSATVAHELNNPIGGILAYARLVKRELAEQPVDPAVREELDRYLTLIDKECARCGGIVRNMLVFARGRGSRMRATDLGEIIDRCLMLVRHHLEMRDIRCEPPFLAGDPVVMADPDQIQQALLALLMNAIEAMPAAKGGTLGIRLVGSDGHVDLSVSDMGGGIPEDVLPKIFEPFYSTKNEQSGVGLGLAVVYGIIKNHGGRIDVRSEIGRGTVFHIMLPRGAQAPDDHGPANTDPPERSATPCAPSPPRS